MAHSLNVHCVMTLLYFGFVFNFSVILAIVRNGEALWDQFNVFRVI
jgi:hypothetical protein